MEWKSIPGFELYEINTEYQVRNIKTGKVLKSYINDNGYRVIRLSRGRKKSKVFRIHRLMLLAFIGPDPDSKKTIVNHKDGDKLNCHLDNLEWCTSSYNNKHAFDTGLRTMDSILHDYRITVGDLDFTVRGAIPAARILKEHGYFPDVSEDNLRAAIILNSNNHKLYRGQLKAERLDDPYDAPEYHICGIKGREIRAELPSGLILKGKGPANLSDKARRLGYWKEHDRDKLVKMISESALRDGYCYGIHVWYV